MNEKLLEEFKKEMLASQEKQDDGLAELQRTLYQHIHGVLEEDDIYKKLTASFVANNGDGRNNWISILKSSWKSLETFPMHEKLVLNTL